MKFHMIDRIETLVPGERAVGIKCWSLDNEILWDHFPGFPTTPGVLLTESMAQLAGVLIEKSYYKEFGDSNRVFPVLSIIQKAKFKKFVRPGDQCIIEAKLLSIDRGRGNAKIITIIDGKEVCSAILSFVVGLDKDMVNSSYMKEKRDEYYQNIMPEKID